MNVLGIDPGSNNMGVSIFNEKEDLIYYEKIELNKEIKNKESKDELATKYKIIFEKLNFIIKKYKIEFIGIEDQFSAINKDSYKKVARVAGICILVSGIHNIPYYMFQPASWRKITHNNGKANKKMTREYVNEKYNLSLKTKDEDISDSMGIALAAIRIEKP